MKAIIKKHPELDFFIGFLGGKNIPTKQDKFKPLLGYQVILEENGEKAKDISKEYDLYIKKKGKTNQLEFEEKFKNQIKANLTEEHPFPKTVQLEVIVSVSMNKKRLKNVDIDNLIKSVLDCFNGLVYEDDSQVINVLGIKKTNDILPENALFVGIRKVDKNNHSWFSDVKLAYFEYGE